MFAKYQLVCLVFVMASWVASEAWGHNGPHEPLELTIPDVNDAPQDGAPFDDNLGYRWKSTSTGPNVTLNLPKNAPLRFRPNGDAGVPIDLITDWTTLEPVHFFFNQATNPDPNSPQTVSHFFLNLELTNKTGTDWKGFKISVIDDNELPYFDIAAQTNGTLRHPERVHLHNDSLKYGLLGFSKVTGFYSVQRTTNPRTGDFVIENRTEDLSTEVDIGSNIGIYALDFADGLIAKNTLWAPTEFIYSGNRTDELDFVAGASVLDIHARRYVVDQTTRTAFVLTLQAVPVPEPSAVSLLVSGVIFHSRRGTRVKSDGGRFYHTYCLPGRSRGRSV